MNNTASGSQPDAIQQRQSAMTVSLCSDSYDNQNASGDSEAANGEDEPPSGSDLTGGRPTRHVVAPGI